MLRGSCFVLLTALVAGCTGESVDFTGQWTGTAEWVIDGEHKDVALAFDLVHADGAIQGTIRWGDLLRQITAGRSEGPEVRLESVTGENSIIFNGLFRNDELSGRYAIKYKIDPEPFPGRFSMTREP